ncbi:hypothetical protein KC19_5G194100 [Ceratodon purpureus]|uniref:Calcium permeable stress-gated cation channel 1 n=1 Tax=Ceratodon purpureus TaxID=3225 RepID=A0A8T0I3A1_CERPU|nr:hypothetical protein KC19_5G194100 [Ceratodon purpureus]
MAGSSGDLLFSFWTNTLLSVVFLICYAFLKNQPLNLRVYFPRLFVKGEEDNLYEYAACKSGKGKLARYVNVNWRSYLRSFNWILISLKKTEEQLIEDVGLDSTVLVRIFLLGLKIFVPMLLWGCIVLIPVNKTDSYLAQFQAEHQNLTNSSTTYDNGPESLSIANVEDLSKRLWAHLLASYLFTGWTCLMLYIEYASVERMRFNFLAAQKQRPDQFTVLVRQVPRGSDPVGERIEEFFEENHEGEYLTHQVVYNAKKLTKLLKKKQKYEGKVEKWMDALDREPSTPRPTVKIRKHWYHFRGEPVDAIDHYDKLILQLVVEIKAERKNILSDASHVMRAGFVSFRSRWGAAVCAQTQQCRDHTKWITEWAPEPRDVYWNNLAINYMMLNSRRLLVTVVVTVLVIFFLIAVGAVQVLANLEELIKYMPFLKPLSKWSFVESFISGFLPAAVLKIFLLIIPYVLWFLTKFEGHVSYSKIEKYTAIKYFGFLVVNVFFGNVLIGSLFDQLKQYLASPGSIPTAFGVSIPKKATFFMTFIMLDGWTSIAAEVLRLWPLIWYHITTTLFMRTAKERVKVIPATPASYFIVLPRLSLYILLGLVYAVISPLILPFICVFFAFGFLIYRNQVLNVYEPKYESAASFWPSMHRNVIIALIIKHITLIGLFSVKKAFASTPFLVPLPIITIMFHLFCSQKFYPAFRNYPLQEAKIKDKQEPNVDVDFLQDAYLHPSIVLAPLDTDSDDDPDTVKNGTAPGGNSPESLSRKGPDSSTPSESTTKGQHDNSLRPTSPRRHIYRENSGSSGNSRRRSKRLSGSHSSAFYDAGSYISSPALSRASSNAVYLDGSSSFRREEVALGSAWSSPYRHGTHVDESDRQHLISPEPATLRHHRGDQTTSDSPSVLEALHSQTLEALDAPQSVDTPHREGENDRREEREFEPRFTGSLQAPLGHMEP